MITVTWKTIGEQTAVVRCQKIIDTAVHPGYLHLVSDGKGMVLHPDQIVSIRTDAGKANQTRKAKKSNAA